MDNRAEANRIARLNDNGSFDTAEEITLLSATTGVINIRPVEAAGMLPADDPALVDLQLGAMLYMKKAAVSSGMILYQFLYAIMPGHFS